MTAASATKSRYTVTLLALESISHGDTLSGLDNVTNTRLFMRSTMLVDGAPIRVPDISENSLRSVIFRSTLHSHLLGALEIGKGELPQPVMNLLFSGGNLASGSSAPGNTIDLGHRVRDLYPTLHLLGGATDSFVLPKSALKLAAWPATREFASSLAYVAPEHVEEAESLSAFDLLSEEVRTRGTGSESSGNQTIYAYEVMAAGTKIVLEVTFGPRTPEQVKAAAALALSEWDGYFGGQGRQGRGRMAVTTAKPGEDTGGEAYLAHIEQHGERMKAGLLDGTLGTGKPLCVAY